MSRGYKARKVESSLKKKGFERLDSHHKYLVLTVRGQVTSIRTRISHSDPEYRGDILSAMRRQLGNLSIDEFEGLVECPLKGPAYLQLLVERGELEPAYAPSTLDGHD